MPRVVRFAIDSKRPFLFARSFKHAETQIHPHRRAKYNRDSFDSSRTFARLSKTGGERVRSGGNRGEGGGTSIPFNPLDYDLKGVTRVWSLQIAGGPLVNVFELIHVCVAIRFMRTRPVRSSLSTDGARRPHQTPAAAGHGWRGYVLRGIPPPRNMYTR